MRFRITFKTPDALSRVILDQAASPMRAQEMRDCAEEFVRYGELLVVEFDTEKGTAEVVPIKGK